MSAETKRGQSISLGGLALQAALSALTCVLWLFSGTTAALLTLLLVLAGMGIWLVSAVLFYCRNMAEIESAEMEQLGRDKGQSAIFGEAMRELRLAQRRLRWMERFFAPGMTLVLSAYLLAMAALMFLRVYRGQASNPPAGTDPLPWAVYAIMGAFVAFLFSRYALGMSRNRPWRLLRAGGSFMTLSALMVALLGAAFVLWHLTVTWGLPVLCYLLPAVMLVLGVELLLNFILDFYRPRMEGVEVRPSFDSRLTSLLSEPGGIAHSIAEALNYQFGFEVSKTWFYQLLQRTFVPLILFGLLVVQALSAVVLVGPGERAVVLTWGKAPAGETTLGPGMHFKWPWPFQTVDAVEVDQVRMVTVGVESAGREEPPEEIPAGVEVVLWTTEHGEHQEVNFVVPRKNVPGGSATTAPASGEAVVAGSQPGGAASRPAADNKERLAQFGLLRIVLSVQYKVRPDEVYRFRYGASAPESLLRDFASQEVVRFASVRDIDMLLGGDRAVMTQSLRDAIQEKSDKEQLGVEILLVTLHAIHPPSAVAPAFEEPIKANLQVEGTILAARATGEARLSSVAGSADLARRLKDARERYLTLLASGAPAEEAARAEQEADGLLDQAAGEARALINEALAYRWNRVNAERGRAESFEQQLAAYRAAPRLYMLNRKLKALADGLKDTRKYLLGMDSKWVDVWLNWQSQRAVGVGITQ